MDQIQQAHNLTGDYGWVLLWARNIESAYPNLTEWQQQIQQAYPYPCQFIELLLIEITYDSNLNVILRIDTNYTESPPSPQYYSFISQLPTPPPHLGLGGYLYIVIGNEPSTYRYCK